MTDNRERTSNCKPEHIGNITTGILKGLSDTTLETKKESLAVKVLEVKQPYALLPNDMHKAIQPLTRVFRLTEKDISRRGPELDHYQKKVPEGQIEFTFTKDLKPNLQLTSDTLVQTMIIAFNEQKTFEPTFTLSDKARGLGYTDEEIQKGGSLFKEIERAEICLADGRYKYANKKKGRERVEEIGSIYANLKIEGEGKGRTFTALLNPKYLRNVIIANGEIQIKGQYFKYPAFLTHKDRHRYEKVFGRWLINKAGLSFTVNAKTVLIDVLGLTDQYYQRKLYCIEALNKCFLIAKETGYTITVDTKGSGTKSGIRYISEYPFNKIKEAFGNDKKLMLKQIGDVRKWKLTITAPKQRKGTRLTEKDLELVTRIVNWGFDKYANFKVRTPRKRVEDQTKAYIRKLGHDTVKHLFDYWGNRAGGFTLTEGGKTINLWTGFQNALKEAKKDLEAVGNAKS